MWLTYATGLTFSHKLEDRTHLVDKSCIEVHKHTNSPIIVKVQAIDGDFLDFKTIKEVVEDVLKGFKGKNITEYAGITTCEEFTIFLVQEITRRFCNLDSIRGYDFTRRIGVHFQETVKYGVTIDA